MRTEEHAERRVELALHIKFSMSVAKYAIPRRLLSKEESTYTSSYVYLHNASISFAPGHPCVHSVCWHSRKMGGMSVLCGLPDGPSSESLNTLDLLAHCPAYKRNTTPSATMQKLPSGK